MQLNKSDIAAAVAAKAGISKTLAGEYVTATIDTIIEAMKNGNDVDFNGFGTFKVKHQNAREVRNPSTGEKIMKPAGKKISFKVKPSLRSAI